MLLGGTGSTRRGWPGQVKVMAVQGVEPSVGVVIAKHIQPAPIEAYVRVVAVFGGQEAVTSVSYLSVEPLFHSEHRATHRLDTALKGHADQKPGVSGLNKPERLTRDEALVLEGMQVALVNYLVAFVRKPISWPWAWRRRRVR